MQTRGCVQRCNGGACPQYCSAPVVTKLPAPARDLHFITIQHRCFLPRSSHPGKRGYGKIAWYIFSSSWGSSAKKFDGHL